MASVKSKRNSSSMEPDLLKSVPLKRRRNGSLTSSNIFSVSTNPRDRNGVSECFHKVSTSLYVSLAPMFLQNPKAGIRTQHLDPLLMTYFAAAGGVVLAHYNLRLFGQNGFDSEKPKENEINGKDDNDEKNSPVMAKIMYDSPFAFLWVSVDFLVWKPLPGDVVEGWINLQSPSHIGVLIHNTFNATIKRDSIPKTWIFVPNQADEEIEQTPDDDEPSLSKFKEPKSLGYWTDDDGKPIQDKLQFTVKSFNISGRMVSVQGTLLEPGTVEDLTVSDSPASKHSTVVESHLFDKPVIIEEESGQSSSLSTSDDDDSI